GQQIERGGMRRRRPWIGLQGFVDVEYPDRQATTREQPSAQQADRPASGNQYPPFVNHARKTAVYLFPRRQLSRLRFATTVLTLKVAKKSSRSITRLKIRSPDPKFAVS